MLEYCSVRPIDEMFTGIIEDVGIILAMKRGSHSARLTVGAPGIAAESSVGDSIAISGVCLTVIARDGESMTFDAVPETIQRTSLRMLRHGDRVNLERALAASGRMGGHFVQGHVDCTGTLRGIRIEENAHVLRISVPAEISRYIVLKGSVAVDGISLTIADVDPEGFTVWIVPHTYEHTTIKDRRVGDSVNIEVDLIARYIERLLAERGSGAES